MNIRQEVNPSKKATEESKTPTKDSSASSGSTINSEKQLFIPEPIPTEKVKVVGSLSGGSSGVVLLAEFNKTSVVLKRSSNNDEEKYLEEEYAVLVSLGEKPANILPLLGRTTGSFCAESSFYIVTQYLTNGSLRNVLDTNRNLEWIVRINIMIGIVCGLAYIHAKKVLHRDIKSQNIFMDEHLVPYIGDFGFAKRCAEDLTYECNGGLPSGTSGHVAPELYGTRRKTFTWKSDVYGLACLFWEIAAYPCRPFATVRGQGFGREKKIIDLVITKDEPLPIPEQCPTKIAHLIRWCWNKNPNERPTEMQVLANLDLALSEVSPRRML